MCCKEFSYLSVRSKTPAAQTETYHFSSDRLFHVVNIQILMLHLSIFLCMRGAKGVLVHFRFCDVTTSHAQSVEVNMCLHAGC